MNAPLRSPSVAARNGIKPSKSASGHEPAHDTEFRVGPAVRLDVLPDERFTLVKVRKTHIWLRHSNGSILQVPKSWWLSRMVE